MTIPPKKYIPIGLRRDKNFSDVNDKVKSLNNLLNDLEGEGTFVSEDLDCIRGLYNDKVTANTLYDLAGITVLSSTIVNTQTGEIREELVKPLVTLKDRVDTARLVTGNIPAYQGGNGLEARFVPSTKVNVGNTNSTGADIFDAYSSSTDLPKEIYWERGVFKFTSKIDPSFPDPWGGIQWEGYFSPSIKDPSVSIGVKSTGLVMIEWDEFEDGNYKQLISWYAKDREVTPTANTNGTTISFSNNSVKYIGKNDFIKYANGTVSTIKVTDVNVSNGLVTLSSTYNSTTTANVIFTKVLGDTESVGYAVLKPVEPGKLHKVRFSYWFPTITDSAEAGLARDKNVTFSYIGSEFYFPYLYKDKPFSPGPYEIRTFLENATQPYQPNIGAPKTATNGDNYKNLNLNGSYISYYVPKSGLTDIRTIGPISISTKANDTVITSGSDFSNAQIGNYIVPASYSDYVTLGSPGFNTKIKGEFSSINLRYVTNAYSVNSTASVNVIDHKGLVGWYFANTNTTNDNVMFFPTTGVRDNYVIVSTVNTSFNRILSANAVAPTNSITLTSSKGIKVGQVVTKAGFIPTNTVITAVNATSNVITISNTITANIATANTILFSPNTVWLRVNTVINSTAVSTSEFLGDSNNTNTIIYVYADKSLIDSSKDVFCVGTFGKVVQANVLSGNTTIVLNSNSGITNGLYIQLNGYIPNNTTVTISGNTVTLSQATTGPITQGTTLTFSTVNTNKEACVIPLDTSPPFIGTSIGLKTGNRGMKGNSSIATFTVVTQKFSASVNATANISVVSGVQQYDRKLPVYSNNSGTFSVLGKSV